MGNAFWSRPLLLLAAMGALSGCMQLTAEAPSPRGEGDPRYLGEAHGSPQDDPSMTPERRTLAARWGGMPDGVEAGTVRVAETARAQPVIHAEVAPVPDNQPTAVAPVAPGSDATKRRTLWDKQPWEVELDKLVRSICRAC